MNKITCPKCKYIWTPRVENPKACPFCKNYLDRELNKKKKS